MASTATMAKAPKLDLTGVTVLVVEDHEDSRDMLRQIVASTGARVLSAANGEDAIALLATKKAPDLVFCDLVMPRMDGHQFMEWLKRQPHLARIPVIAVSALGAEADIMKTWSQGFSGHLVKPVDFWTIMAQLHRIFWAHKPN
jgi:two-component system cell cycle response regulator DivK